MTAREFFKHQKLDENAKFSALDMMIFASDFYHHCLKVRLKKLITDTLDLTKIDNVVLEDVSKDDYPDFVDAYILSCDYKGEPADELTLDIINEHTDFVHEQVMKQLF